MTDYIYDRRGNAVGFIRGRYIHSMQGKAIGQLNGTHVHKLTGAYVGELHEDMILDKRHGNYGNIGNAGNPGNPGSPGNPGNRGAVNLRENTGKLVEFRLGTTIDVLLRSGNSIVYRPNSLSIGSGKLFA